MKTSQACTSRTKEMRWRVPSESRPGLYFDVEYMPREDEGKPPLWSCSCEAWQYRKQLTLLCKHVAKVKEDLCRWSGAIGPEQQTKKQRWDMVCPRCGGKTYSLLGKKPPLPKFNLKRK